MTGNLLPGCYALAAVDAPGRYLPVLDRDSLTKLRQRAAMVTAVQVTSVQLRIAQLPR